MQLSHLQCKRVKANYFIYFFSLSVKSTHEVYKKIECVPGKRTKDGGTNLVSVNH